MRRTDLLDTSPEIHRARVKILQEKGPEWRLQKTFELCDLSRTVFEAQTRAMFRKMWQERTRK